jgi:hypothetical protein
LLFDSLAQWFAFLESVKGVRLRGGGVDFAGSLLVFPGRSGAPFSAPVLSSPVSALGCQSFPLIRYGHEALAQRARSQPGRSASAFGTQEPGNNGALYSRRFRASSHARRQDPTPRKPLSLSHEPSSTKGGKPNTRVTGRKVDPSFGRNLLTGGVSSARSELAISFSRLAIRNQAIFGVAIG